jgi:Luciferase-like monooxygenase
MAPLSVLDLSPIVEGGDAAQSLRNSLDLARHTERWGYRRYWLAEHHNSAGIASAATAVVIQHVASGTSTIRVGASGANLRRANLSGAVDQHGVGELQKFIGRTLRLTTGICGIRSCKSTGTADFLDAARRVVLPPAIHAPHKVALPAGISPPPPKSVAAHQWPPPGGPPSPLPTFIKFADLKAAGLHVGVGVGLAHDLMASFF